MKKLTNHEMILPGAERTNAYIPELAQMMGNDVDGAILLCQLVFWHGKAAKSNDGWTRKSQAELQRETGLTRSRQENARRKLRDLDFIREIKNGKSPPVIGFRLNVDEISASWSRFKENPGAVKAQIKESKARQSKRVLPRNIPTELTKRSGRNGFNNEPQRSTTNRPNAPDQSALSPQNLYIRDDYTDGYKDETLRLSSPSPSGTLDDHRDVALLSPSTSGVVDYAEMSRPDAKQDTFVNNRRKAQPEIYGYPEDEESDDYYSSLDDTDPYADE